MNRNFLRTTLVIAITLTGTLARAQSNTNFFGNQTPLAPSIPSIRLKDSGIKIVSAVWGSGDHFVDVTDTVIALLARPDTTFNANPDSLKSDPSPGWNKALVIVYELDGDRCLSDSGEDAEVSLQMLKDHAVADKKK